MLVYLHSSSNQNKTPGPDSMRRSAQLFHKMFTIALKHTFYAALKKKLLNVEVNPDLILWIRQFLCDRPQRVRLNGPLCRDPVLSDERSKHRSSPTARPFPNPVFRI